MIQFVVLTESGQRVRAAEAVLPLEKAAAALRALQKSPDPGACTLASALRKRYTTSMRDFPAQEHGG